MSRDRLRIGVVIVARMTSSRLPGKVMMPVEGRPLLEWLIKRVKKSQLVSEIVVATTINPTDDLIEILADKLKVRCFRGSESDVLLRVLGAAKSLKLDVVVHITGDCPLSDYRIIDKMVRFFLKNKVDYVKNFQWGRDARPELTFPNGLDVEVFYTKSLEKLDNLTDDPWIRQHVTEPFYTWSNFKFATSLAEPQLRGLDIRICLDTQEDLLVIKKIFKYFKGKNKFFSGKDIVRFLRENPEIMKINSKINQNKYNATVIGLGNIGSRYDQLKNMIGVNTHSGAYMRWPKTHLVAGCDPDISKQKCFVKAWGVKTVYFDPERMLKEIKPDIVSICTPLDTHAEIVKLCVKHGVRAILCEKPFVRNIEEGKKIIELCSRNRIILAVNHWMRYSDIYRDLKERLNQGILGSIYSIRYHYSKGLYNSGSHAIDILRYLFGQIDKVIATGSNNLDTGDNNISGILKFSSGVFVNLTTGDYRDHFTTEIDIIGQKGRIRLADNDHLVEFYKSCQSPYGNKTKELVRQKDIPFSSNRGEFMIKAVSNLIDALEGRGRVLCSGEDALEAIKVIDKLCLSFRKNGSWERVK